MAYEYQSLDFFSNEDPQFSVTMTPAESVSGWDVECVILNTSYGTVQTVEIGDGITVDDSATGEFTVELAQLAAGVYHYFVTRTSPGRRVLAAGLITVTRAG